MHLARRAAPLGALTILVAGLVGHAAALAATGACAGQANCVETASFVATITDFRTSVSGNDRVATATLRFESKLDRPLILGYVTGSGVVTDDQGNRYVPGPDSVRGLGAVTASKVDAKFALEPGEASDARVEFTWKATKATLGTVFDVDLTVQEIEAVTGGQFKAGKERVLHFTDAGQKSAAGAPATATGTINPASDPCAGLQRCASGGSFIAQVASLTPVGGTADRHHSLKLNLAFRNVSSQPVILGYKSTSSTAIDNLGNAYVFGRPGTYDTSFSGIGLVTDRAADPSFVLNPGESRNAAFTVVRFNSGGKELGTAWTYAVVVSQLEILPSQQVRTGREHSLNFNDLTAGMPAVATGVPATPADLKKTVDDLKKLFRKN